MAEIYGSKWESQYGAIGGSAFETWHSGLAALTTDQIKRGLEALIEEGHDWPPNMIKFHRLCRDAKPTMHKPLDVLEHQRPAHESVMRVEQAKQRALSGRAFRHAKIGKHVIRDWTPEDEREVERLIGEWRDESEGLDPVAKLDALNAKLDHHSFSGGTIASKLSTL